MSDLTALIDRQVKGFTLQQEFYRDRALFERDIRPRYLGVIGSRRKAVRLKKDLMAKGIPESDAERIRIPMGLDIGAADPPVIAVSVVAELVATLRGASEQRW